MPKRTYPSVRVAALTVSAHIAELLDECDAVDFGSDPRQVLTDCDLVVVEGKAAEEADESALRTLADWTELEGRAPLLVIDPSDQHNDRFSPIRGAAQATVRAASVPRSADDRVLRPWFRHPLGTVRPPPDAAEIRWEDEGGLLVGRDPASQQPVVASTGSNDWESSRDALALAATGVAVVGPSGSFRFGPKGGLDEAVIGTDSALDGRMRESLRRASVAARRATHRSMTAAHVVREVLDAVRVPYAEPAEDVGLLLMSNKPDRIPGVIASMEQQTHAERHLMIGIHGPAGREQRTAIDDALERARATYEVHTFPQARPLGACLNDLASRCATRYLAKIDDDDYYGPNHLVDSIQALRYSGADIVGRATYFVYVEADDSLIVSNLGNEETDAGRTHLIGGSLVMDRAAWDRCPFPNRPQRVDSLLARSARAASLGMYSVSRYEFAYRRLADGHTWDADAGRFRARGEEVPGGWSDRSVCV